MPRVGLAPFVRSEHKFRVQSQAVKVLKRDKEAIKNVLYESIVSQLLSKGITSTLVDIESCVQELSDKGFVQIIGDKVCYLPG